MDKIWQRHEIELLGQNRKLELSLETSGENLNSNAQDLHEKFLMNTSHLSEVQNNHQKIISDISIDLEETKMKIREIKVIDDIIGEFGGTKTDLGIAFPIPSRSPDDLILQTKSENETQIIQILSTQIFGGLLRTFKLPPGKEIEKINWNNGIVELLFT